MSSVMTEDFRLINGNELYDHKNDPGQKNNIAEDFPEIVIDCINIHHSLGNRMYPEIGYMGKDYTNLPFYMKIHKVEDEDLFLNILLEILLKWFAPILWGYPFLFGPFAFYS